MAKPTFYWHDYETWGANPRVDRPAQFAGIRTDENLEIIGDALMIYSQPTPDFLPNPEAVLITGITPQLAAAEGVTEAEFFRQIHAQYSQPGTCIVGYNSLRFDEEVTRFGFYRNFYDPYAYSWQNSNSRWDVLDLMRLTHALRPEGINWPVNDAGMPSFKLTDLTAANGIQQVGAHDALVDVKATIAVAKLVKQHQPRLFDFYFALRHKQRVAELVNIAKPQVLLHVSGMFPADQGCLAPVLPLLANPSNPNEIICYNLRVNPEQFLQLSVEQIQQKLYARSVDLAEGEQRIPLKGIHLNKSPAVAPVKTLSDTQAQKWAIDWDEINRHHQTLVSDTGLITRLNEVYVQRRDYDQVDADSALYDGFIGSEDRLRCNQILAATPQQLADWPAESFQDERLQALLFRYRARNYPHTLNEKESKRWMQFCQSRLMDGDFGAGLTLEQFQQHLITLAQNEQGEREQQLLEQLSQWVQRLFESG
jgi:exodeoxyribonuclease-1